jgi:hypothetical protein
MPIEIVCIIVFGVLATVLAVAAMIQSYLQWRRERRSVIGAVFSFEPDR